MNQKKEITKTTSWVARTFLKRVRVVLPFPFLDFTIRVINSKKSNDPLQIRFNPDNYSANIFLFHPQFLKLLKKDRKRVLEQQILNGISSIYLGKLKLLLTDKERTKNQVNKAIEELSGNLAFLIKNLLKWERRNEKAN